VIINIRPAATIVAVVLCGTVLVAGQTPAPNPLAAIKQFKCAFPVYSQGTWRSGAPKADIREGAQLAMEISEIDPDGGTAVIQGTAAPIFVTAFLAPNSIHFMERAITGALNITTVFAPVGTSQVYKAVQSRHDYSPLSLPGFVAEPTVLQSYGECSASAVP